MQVIEHPVERRHTALLSTWKDLIETYQQFISNWIPAHPEDPQDFQSFCTNSYRRSPSSGHNTIYIQTIGYSMLNVVKLLPPVTVASTACSFRISGNTHNLQLYAAVVALLQSKRPEIRSALP
uniref:Uncharacterized protein n=1 Tax=Cyprinus carpio TaxID=7962 RepID=A0A8C2FI85_CYPCA